MKSTTSNLAAVIDRGHIHHSLWGAGVGATVGIVELHAAFVTTGRMEVDAAIGVIVYASVAGLVCAAATTLICRMLGRKVNLSPQSTNLLAAGSILGGFYFFRALVDAIWYLWVDVQTSSLELIVCLAATSATITAVVIGLFWIRRKTGHPPASMYPAVTMSIFGLVYGGFYSLRVAVGFHLPGETAVGAHGPHVYALYLSAAAVLSLLSFWLTLLVRRNRAWILLASFAIVPLGFRVFVGPEELSRVVQSQFEARHSAPGTQDRPNVILIVLDTCRADHLELYGYRRRTMPNLTRLAANGVTFLNATSTSSWTLPGHASLFTGLYPAEHGALGSKPVEDESGATNYRPLPDDVPVIAEILGRNGYRTAGVAGNYGWLSPQWGLARGFEYWDSRATFHGAASTGGYLPLIFRSFSLVDYLPVRWVYAPLTRFDVAQTKARRAEEINRDVVECFESCALGEGSPFFLFINYMDPHDPYNAPGRFNDRFPGRIPNKPRRIEGSRRAGLSESELREHLGSQYDSELAYLDHHLGKLFQFLDDRGYFENSIIIVTSDHGEALGEHDHVSHGNSVYDEEILIPLIIYEPGFSERGRAVDAPAELRGVPA